MPFWQPRSVLQLILVSFFAALAPVCAAILFTVNTLAELTENDRRVTVEVVTLTRLGQETQRDLLEMERHARQYLAVGDPGLAQLFEHERADLSQRLAVLQTRIPGKGDNAAKLVRSLRGLALPSPEMLANATTARASKLQLDESFFTITEQARSLQSWLLASVDQLLAENAAETDAAIHALLWQVSVLAVATLALLLICAYWINKPVQNLTRAIHQLGTAGLGHNITISGPSEIQALGGELEWLRERLHQSEQQQQRFLRHISHELKTPLASLREGTDLLSEQVTGTLSQQQRAIVTIVRQNGIELQRLIENLLDYNQAPTPDAPVEDIDLQALWRDVLANHKISIERKNLQLQLHGAQVNCTADRHKLATTLDNLLSNAVNYTPEGGDIDIRWQRTDQQLEITVANSGDAIPAEDANRIFEPFFQSSARRSGPIKGSGIGLSVARECTEAQGGSLNLAKHETLPVCFCVTLPAC